MSILTSLLDYKLWILGGVILTSVFFGARKLIKELEYLHKAKAAKKVYSCSTKIPKDKKLTKEDLERCLNI